jgi:hypothetical protein
MIEQAQKKRQILGANAFFVKCEDERAAVGL